MSLDLETHLVKYGSYHHNQTNINIHMICVPLILMTGYLCIGAQSGVLFDLPSWLKIPYLEPNMCTISSLVWGGFFLLMEPVAGGLLCLISISMAAADNYFYSLNPRLATQVSAAIFVLCWIGQFVGHGKYEKRAPALLDNLVQAIFLAPLFVWIELLFAFGYRQDLRDRVAKKVEINVAKFRQEKALKNGKAQ